MMRFLLTLLAGSTLLAGAGGCARTPAASPPPATLDQKLAALPTELWLADSSLHVVNLYKLEGVALRETAGQPQSAIVDRLVHDVYAPWTTFWNGYLGGEGDFREWATGKLLAPDHPVRTRMAALLDVGLDRRFIDGTDWIRRTTGRRPRGTWYIVFGPGWTDMGGLGGIGMVADFTKMQPDAEAIAGILPHELTHQVHGSSPARANDPDRGTVLDRIVSEGFASYVAWVYAGGRRTPAQALMYPEDGWSWALAHEADLRVAAAPLLRSKRREDVDRVSSRSEHLIAGSPGADGYFLGYRLVQAYVAKRGRDSWKEIYDLPVADVVTRACGEGLCAPSPR
ncbi:MAG: DUF2268 domain-containing putative Zn-dependent protease [Bacillota bacterium]|jgi:hypothetical protein